MDLTVFYQYLDHFYCTNLIVLAKDFAFNSLQHSIKEFSEETNRNTLWAVRHPNDVFSSVVLLVSVVLAMWRSR
jgi:hypothetical protein